MMIMLSISLDTINNVLTQVLQVAMDDELIRKNPATGVYVEVKKAHNYERPKRKALTLEQQNAFVKQLQKDAEKKWKGVFAVLLGTGCRVGEFTALRWCDIDWDKNVINVNHAMTYGRRLDGTVGYWVTTPKTKAGIREIPMMPDVRKALEEEKQRQDELGIQCRRVIDGYTDCGLLPLQK